MSPSAPAVSASFATASSTRRRSPARPRSPSSARRPASWTSILHPDFRTNGLIYLSYHKPARGEYGNNAIFRGRWNGKEIVDGKDIFVSDDVDALYTKMAFGPDGKLYVTIGCPGVGTDDSIGRAQKPDDYAGKTLRLNDDGTVPKDNPFVGQGGLQSRNLHASATASISA